MITPINNYQSNVNFNASMQAPKFKKGVKNVGAKIKDFGTKVKNEFNSLDNESKMYLYKSIVLLSALIAFCAYVGYIVKTVVDKFQALFE